MNLCIWIPNMTRYMYCWQYMSITCTVSHDFVYQYKAFGKPPWKPKNTEVGSLSLLQRIILTQESNQGLLHCRRILYQLSYQGSPNHLGVHLIIQDNLWGLKCISDSLFSGIIFFSGGGLSYSDIYCLCHLTVIFLGGPSTYNPELSLLFFLTGSNMSSGCL